ncbi:MAG: TGS domain-containing protein, partial [Candidatus Margulisbacteria bacterium]|nr:TGS domain-containing protein [Candidatus Margulisiibacteriota bacterium]
DRLHNMRTLQYKASDKRYEKAFETLNVYARIADILGMWQLKRELEDWSFLYLEPDKFKAIEQRRSRIFQASENDIAKIKLAIEQNFATAGLKVEIPLEGRHVYELYQRMQQRGITDVEQLTATDIWRLNIVVPERAGSYVALGRLHELYEPIQKELCDYIGDPRSNGHRFLHTYVVVPLFGRLLVQIRDRKMFAHYRFGIMGLSPAEREQEKQRQTWLTAARSHLEEGGLSTEETYEIIRLVSAPIKAYTPNGDEIELPFGSTVLDFARSVHEEVLYAAAGGIVNGQRVEIFHELQYGDRVDVIKDEAVIPTLEWLEHVRTPEAKSSIRVFLSIQANIDIYAGALKALDAALKKYFIPAKDLIETDLFSRFVRTYGSSDSQAFLLEIGKGRRNVEKIVRELRAYYRKLFKRIIKKAAEQPDEFSPYYLSIETEDERGKLKILVNELDSMGYNIHDIFQADSEKPEKAIIVFAVDLLPRRGLAGTLRRIQTIQVQTIAATVGATTLLRPDGVEALRRRRRI